MGDFSWSLPWRENVESRTNAYVRERMRWFPLLRSSYVESWLDTLGDLAVPSLVARLSSDDRDLLIDERWRRTTGQPSWPAREFDELVHVLEDLVRRAASGSPLGAAFLRLGSCAPLDEPALQSARRQVDGGADALNVLLGSERLFDDLCLAQECGYQPCLIVRPWLEVSPAREVRLTLSDGVLTTIRARYSPRRIVDQALAAEALPVLARVFPQGTFEVDLIVEGRPLVLDVSPVLPPPEPAPGDAVLEESRAELLER